MSAPKKPKVGREREKARSFPWGPGLKPLKRRTFLRGAVGGAAIGLALPTLDAMLGPSGAHADGTTAGPIFGVFFWANGLPWHAGMGGETAGVTYPDLWTPAATGVGFAPSELLMPLSRHRVSVVTGLEPKTEVPPNPPGQSDGHMRGFMVAMTGDLLGGQGAAGVEFLQPIQLVGQSHHAARCPPAVALRCRTAAAPGLPALPSSPPGRARPRGRR